MSAVVRRRSGRYRRLFYQFLQALGPGVVSGASDTDPTTVATMAVVGSTTGYRLSWLALLTYPMLANVQFVSARIGLVTRKGLQELVRRRYGKRWAFILFASVVAVNVVTLGADLEAGAAAIGLVVNLDYRWFTVPLAAVLLLLLVFGSYQRVERVLKYVLVVLFAYVAAAFLAHPHWNEVLRATTSPGMSFEPRYLAPALAILGTTLTSYAYVWEAVEEAERRLPIRRLGLAQADAALGMIVAVGVMWFILVATAATAGAHHHPVQTAADAAAALQPFAGPAAKYLFAAGLLASACIAVPVLSATTAYLAGAEFEFPSGLSKRLGEAREFYVILSLAMGVAVAISLAGIAPVRLLFAASIAGAFGTPISLAFLLLVARDRRVMRRHTLPGWSSVVGWSTLVVVALTAAWLLVQAALPLVGR
jgi:Mn2+/Fe2+ NRAMP family transporter